MTAQPYPLEGVKVLDFSRVLAGPFAGRLLCDLGADVVKVEPPDNDITRLWGKKVGGFSGYFHQQNAGKRNISVDLRADGARELIFDLVKTADLVIENYRPDVMPRLGLGYEDLKAVNPKIIMLSISGFGSGGPESHKPAYAPIIHAEAGLMHRQAGRCEIPPSDIPLSVADTNASLHGLIGLLSALLLRERTGLGQHIEIAMIDATVATDDQLHYDLEGSEQTGPLPNDVWQTGAGPILVSGDFRWIWRLLVDDFGVVDPTHKEMELEEKIRLRRDAAAQFMLSLDTWEAVEAAMAKVNVAWGEVRDPATLRDQPTLKHRQSITDIDNQEGGTRPIQQSPYRFSDARSGIRGPAAHRGQHNQEVLADWLGSDAATIAELRAKAVLCQDDKYVD